MKLIANMRSTSPRSTSPTVQGTLSPEVSLREHHHDEKWRPRSSGGSDGKKRRLPENNKDVEQSSKRTRKSQIVHSNGKTNTTKERAGPGAPRAIGVVKPTLERMFLYRFNLLMDKIGGVTIIGKMIAGKSTTIGEADKQCSTSMWKQIANTEYSVEDIQGK